MKKTTLFRTTLLLFLLFTKNFTLNAQVLDQQYLGTSNGIYLTSGNQIVGQSFTAGITGLLSSIEVNSAGIISNGPLTLNVYSGQGFTGTLLSTQQVSITANVVNSFTITTPVNVLAGSKYTFQLISTSSSMFFYMGAAGYSGGDLYFPTTSTYPNYDMWFKTYVTITNNAPTDIALSSSSINENVPANSVVGTLTSTDPDSGNTFTYSLVSGTGATDNSSFTIIGANLQINLSPDFETKSSYSIRIRTTDQDGLYFEKQFTISINDLLDTTPASSLSFDGVNDRVALPRFDFSGNSALTIEAWVKPTDITTHRYYEISRQDTSSNIPDWLVSFQEFGTILSFGLRTTTGYNELDVPITASQFTDGNWHHLAVVYDGVTKKVYKDGVLIGTQNKTGTIVCNASSINIIGDSPASLTVEPFKGNIDEIHFWDRALQQCEIQNNLTGELPSGQTNLFAYYQFNQGDANGANTAITSLNDSSGNLRNGTLTNFTLTGTTSNWTSPGGVISGTNAPVFTNLSATVSSTDVTTCFGGSNGTAMVTASGGFGAYTYLWSPSGGTGATASGLSAGNYSCTITSSGCSVVKNITIGQPSLLPDNTTTVSACDSYTWTNTGQTYTSSGIYTGTTTNCVTEKLDLTITPNTINTTTTSACNSYTWANTGQTYTSSGIYTGTTTNCVTEKLNLTIIQATQPAAVTTQVYTGSATLADLTVIGTNINWYDAATFGTLLPTSTSLVDSTTYYASQTISGCESPTRVAVTVRKISEATQSFCETNATVGNLIATPSSGYTANWFTSATGGTPLTGSTALTSGTYYVEESNASSSIVGSGFSYPYGVAIDAVGNIYVADSANNAIKKMDANGNNIVTLGSGFNLPFGIAVDTSGNIYVADSGNNAIKKMDPTGTTITTIGTGFNNPFSLSVDAAGNVFVADNDNNLVKKINSTYTSITSLGSGFVKPLGIDVDTAGNIYVTDFGSNTIKKMDSNGNNIVTLATTTSLPRGVTVGPNGEIVFSQGNGEIRSMDSNGNNQVLLGVQPEPTGLAFNPSGVLHLASTSSSSIRKLTGTTSNRVPVTIVVNPITTHTTTVSTCTTYTWANNGQTYTTSGIYTGTTANCITEKLNLTIIQATQPTAVATQVYAGSATLTDLTVTGTNINWYDASAAGTLLPSTMSLVDGTIYYASQTVSGCESPRVPVTVRKISEATQTLCSTAYVSSLVTTPSSGATASWFTNATGGSALPTSTALSFGTYYVEQSSLNIPSLGSGFYYPYTVALDASGTIYVADSANNAIKKMDANGNNIVTLGSGFSTPLGIAVDAAGNIYVADTYNNMVKKMDNNGNNITVLGTFNHPVGITLDGLGHIFITNTNSNEILKMNTDGSNVTSLASGQLSNPLGIAVDSTGKIYVADFFTNTVKKMNGDGTNILTIGSGYNGPFGVAVDSQNNVYVTDQGNDLVIKMDSDGGNPTILGSGFSGPDGVAVDANGVVFVADTRNWAIKKIVGSTSNRVAVGIIITQSTTNTTTVSSVGAYNWPVNGTTYTNSGSYTYVNGCDTQNLSLTIIPIDNSTTLVNGVITANQSNVTYQWIDCATNQPVTGATNQTFTPTAVGSYQVVLSVNGAATTSSCVTVSTLGTQTVVKDLEIAIAPNPSTGKFFVQIPTDMQVEVYNNLGQLLVSQKMSLGINMVDISNKSAGVYLLKVIDGDKVSIYKIVKKD